MVGTGHRARVSPSLLPASTSAPTIYMLPLAGGYNCIALVIVCTEKQADSPVRRCTLELSPIAQTPRSLPSVMSTRRGSKSTKGY